MGDRYGCKRRKGVGVNGLDQEIDQVVLASDLEERTSQDSKNRVREQLLLILENIPL